MPEYNPIREIKAIVRKEFRCEWRSPHAFLTGGLFGVISVVAISVAAYDFKLSGTLAAGLLWVVIAFTVIGSLPRTLISEEENGTGDFLRLTSNPHSVYWGKMIFNFIVCLAQSLVTAILFLIFNSISVVDPVLLIASLVSGALALTGAVTFCGAVAAKAANRQALAAALALPLVLPIAAWAVTSMRVSFGEGFLDAGRLAAIGLFAFGVLTSAIGPYLYAALWKK